MSTPAETMARGAGDTTRTTRAACSYCGVGCGITVTSDTVTSDTVTSGTVRDLRLVSKVTGDKTHPANHGRLCTKGATHAEVMAAPGRMTTAYVRPERGEPAVAVALETAVAEAARRLRAIIDVHGPDAVALYVSGQMSTEAQYLANKLTKGYLRSIHIESNSRLCMASAGTGYKQSLGADGPPGSYEDFDTTDLFFVIGSNTADCHPILFLRMTDRLKDGAKLIVVDPRRTATADRADLFLQIAPGTDLALLNGLLHLLVADGRIDREFIAAHTEGWEAMPDFLAAYDPATVSRVTGLAEDDIRTAARWIGDAGNWMTLWTMGLNQSTHGTWNTTAICNLHLATGAICRPGSGPFSLTGQPNAMGGREMGYMGPGLPGQRSVFSADDRSFVEERWGLAPGSLRSDAGSGTIEMYRSMVAGDIKAAWIMCTNPVASVANRRTVIEGLEAAELVIVQDIYTETATNAYADVLLPAAMWVESDGVMVNSDRTMTLTECAVAPVGDAQPDWLMICLIARALGFDEGFDFTSSEEVFDEIREFWNPQTGWDVRGVSYGRLREGSVQWPAPPDDAQDRHPIRYLNDGVSQSLHTEPDGSAPRVAFPTPSRRAQFLPRPHMDPAELPDDDYPWVLNTGRLQHQWHTMTKTGKVAKLMKLNPGPFIEINTADAGAHGLADGDQVEVASRRGRVVLPAVVTDRVRPGNCFAPFHWNDAHGEYLTVNAVTSDAVDTASMQPEFKYTAVTMRRVGPAPSAAAEPATGLDHAPPELGDIERTYLSGFFSAVDAAPPTQGAVPVLPASAPVSAAARAWFDGVLAGTHSRIAPVSDAGEVTVLWGSQTGNAEEFAASCAAALTAQGVRARILGMSALRPGQLTDVSTLIVVTSTFGDGGPPDNGIGFWTALRAPDAPDLSTLRYAVLAMGDSSYADFCGHGRSVDERLSALGAMPLLPRVDCEPDDPAADVWLAEVIGLLSGDDAGMTPAAAPVTATKLFTRANPVRSRLSTNVLLSGPGAAKEVRTLGFDLSERGITYDAGDSLGVVCTNGVGTVGEWLDATGLSASERVEIAGAERSLGDALLTSLDITSITPALLRFVQERTGDAMLAKLMRSDAATGLEQFLWTKQTIDLLTQFPVRATAAEWVEVLGALQPRRYSISSSPKTSPEEVQLTVSILRWQNDAGTPRGGVCSTFLADGIAASAVPIYLQRSTAFRPPSDPKTPMIMVGPGTGIAPFRGFLHDRRADGYTGRNWLFFGEQHESNGFYYRDELMGMRDDGFLTRLDLAFSRDQRQKIYVQHRMLEHGAELWRWLHEGAHFYVCGDATRMARDVDAALTRVAMIHGGLDEDAAAEFTQGLVAAGRYVRDVY